MGKLGNTIYELHTIESLARKDQWINRIHPLVKLVLTIFYIAVVVSFSKYDLAHLLLIVKGCYSVFASYLLIATTTVEQICYALRRLHLPAIFVTQILLTYRYVSVLLSEANRMMQAYSLRAPRQKGIHFKAWGSFVGQLLLRSMDRAGAVYESMALRGYQGEFRYAVKGRCGWKDYVYLLGWCVVLAGIRLG